SLISNTGKPTVQRKETVMCGMNGCRRDPVPLTRHFAKARKTSRRSCMISSASFICRSNSGSYGVILYPSGASVRNRTSPFFTPRCASASRLRMMPAEEPTVVTFTVSMLRSYITRIITFEADTLAFRASGGGFSSHDRSERPYGHRFRGSQQAQYRVGHRPEIERGRRTPADHLSERAAEARSRGHDQGTLRRRGLPVRC